MRLALTDVICNNNNNNKKCKVGGFGGWAVGWGGGAVCQCFN